MNFKIRNCTSCLNLYILFLFLCSLPHNKAHGKNLKIQLEEFKESALEDSESKGDPSKISQDSSDSSASKSSSLSSSTDNPATAIKSDSDCPGNSKSINPTTRKCVQVLANDVLNYAVAKSLCRRRKSSDSDSVSDGSVVHSLLTIDSEEEQKEVTKLLFNSLAISDNVWLDGYRRLKSEDDPEANQGFKWFDGRSMDYSNWRQGAPSERHGNKCVQMAPDGQWADVTCTKKNVAVCQSVRRITLESLQSTVLDFQKTVKVKLEEDERIWNETRKLVESLTLKVQKQEKEQQLQKQKEAQEQVQKQKQEDQQEPQKQQNQQQPLRADTVKHQNTVSAVNVTESCQDKSPYCDVMEPGMCQDSKHGVWYRVMCRKTCEECGK